MKISKIYVSGIIESDLLERQARREVRNCVDLWLPVYDILVKWLVSICLCAQSYRPRLRLSHKRKQRLNNLNAGYKYPINKSLLSNFDSQLKKNPIFIAPIFLQCLNVLEHIVSLFSEIIIARERERDEIANHRPERLVF